MKIGSTIVLILAVQMMPSNSTFAQEMSLGSKAGTVGVGIELTLAVTRTVNVRIGGNYFKFGTEIEIEDNNYAVDLKLNNYTIFTDWYLFDSRFHLTGGFFINKNVYKGAALLGSTYVINGIRYSSEEVGVLTAVVKSKRIAPYLGIGWGNPVANSKKWTFTVNAGVVFAGDPKLDIRTTEGSLSKGPFGGSTELTENIKQAEENFRNSEDLKYLNLYPVISVGLHYQF